MTDKLMPCPFCGSETIGRGHIRDGRMVSCMRCGAAVRAFKPNALEEATIKWNTRAPAITGRGEAVPDREAFWLVERTGTGLYVKTGPGDLTDNVWHAHRFDNERAAFDYARLSQASWAKDLRATEHLFVNKVVALSPQAQAGGDAQAETKRRWRHKKRGTTYVEVGRGNLQIATDPVEEDDRVVIYRSEADGRLWVRGEAEFQDGRFEALSLSSTHSGAPSDRQFDQDLADDAAVTSTPRGGET